MSVRTMTFVDFHNHVIPGVDDGAESLEQSIAALNKMWDQGITHVIATPHFRASTVNNPANFESHMGLIDAAWAVLKAAAREVLPTLLLERGVELALDEPIVSVLDSRLRLAGSRFVLLEFPYFTIPPNSGLALMRFRQLGLTPIVAHPERYENLSPDLATLSEWKGSGAFLQMNAGSLVGAYGGRITSTGWKLLELGLADYLSSDYHSRGNCLVARARELLEGRGGAAQFRTLSAVNGDRLLHDLAPTPVQRLPMPAPKWRKLGTMLGRSK